MGSSKKKYLAYIFLFILYNGSVYKVLCNSIEDCSNYLSAKLGGNKSAVGVIIYLFNNGHPNEIYDANNSIDNLSTRKLIKLNRDLHFYIDDITKNMNINSKIVPTIIEFCKQYATDKKNADSALEYDEVYSRCNGVILCHLEYTNINKVTYSSDQNFRKAFKLILNHVEFHGDILTKFKNSMMAGATTQLAIKTVFDVDTFCLHRYTNEFQDLVNVKRIKVGINSDGTPRYEKYTSKKRHRNEGPSNQPRINFHD